MAEAYKVEFTERAITHLEQFAKRTRNVILDDVRAQLPHQPNVETKNRKLLRGSTLADWELRVGQYRVFYDIDEGARVVRIVAVGYKEHNDLYIEGEKFEL
jgi:mRNA-degrading endonuclease RelE of RelBE toxin-antitoxin system